MSFLRLASVVTSKPAIEGHFKTGQRPRPGLEVSCTAPRGCAARGFLIAREGFSSEEEFALWDSTLARPGADQREAAMASHCQCF
jgi:hypothetical protein